MQFKKMILISGISAISLTGCGEDKSQVVVLYKHSVSPGNSVVNFVNYSDPYGVVAETYCEELRKVFSQRYKITYICSTEVFEEFTPSVKWGN